MGLVKYLCIYTYRFKPFLGNITRMIILYATSKVITVVTSHTLIFLTTLLPSLRKRMCGVAQKRLQLINAHMMLLYGLRITHTATKEMFFSIPACGFLLSLAAFVHQPLNTKMLYCSYK